jgi:acyl-CoA synthetase (AMP-forming)/AMP-acid ligase II
LALDGEVRATSDAAEARVLVSNGPSGDPEAELFVVDPATREVVPEGAVGEIWLRGPCVARGYHGGVDPSDDTFRGVLADGRGPFLRTGDLGALVDGDVFITGRGKDVVIAQGRNLDAHDVEAAATVSVADHRHGLTLALGALTDDGERLVVLQELGRSTDDEQREVCRRIQVAVADLVGVRPEVVLVAMGSLPRTTSGKLRRAEGRRQHAAGELAVLGVDEREAVGAP